ncbi:MAG: DNA primase, partial [Proteobacteria bacterium]
RDWAYSAVRKFWRPGGEERWRAAVRLQAEALNTFAVPLGAAEVAGIARSVARYVWRRFSPAEFREVQAVRGRRGGIASGAARLAVNEDKRASARLMAANGMSIRSIADELGVGKSTVARWVSHEAISGSSTQGVEE